MIGRIGNYEILSELGRGGFGRVYRARDPRMNREVAIKVLVADNDPDLLSRFHSEAGTTGNLKHKNIVTVYEYGEHQGVPYIVMELLEGRTLQQLIEQREPLSLLDKVRILHQVAEGLHCAHLDNIIHRDVKPANIMVMAGGAVKIMDFGIARVISRGDTRRTQQGQLIGTVMYMAPEYIKTGDTDVRADIFAFGVIAHELLAGEHPFAAKDHTTVMYRITAEDPPPLRHLLPECPPALELIVQRAMAKDRDLRYQSLDDLLFDLQPILMEQRQQRAAALMAEVRSLMASGQAEVVQTMIRQALELDPGNREARQAREKLVDEVHRRQMRARIEALMQEGEQQLAQRHFAEAIQKFEAVLRLDSSIVRAATLMEEARERREAARRCSVLLSEARREIQRGNLTGAYSNVLAALEADGANREASLLRDNLHQQLEARDKQRRLHAALQKAEGLRAQGDYAGALKVLEEIEGQQPGSLLVAGLRASIETDQAEEARRLRIEQFQAGMNRAHAAVQGNRLEEAAQLLEELSRRFPDQPAAAQLLATVREQMAAHRRSEAIRKISAEAVALLQAQKFAEARRRLEEGLRSYPDDPGLRRLIETANTLQAAHERAGAVARVLAKARDLRGAGQLEEALEAVRAGINAYGQEAGLVEFKGQLELEREEQRYARALHEALEQGRGLLSQGRAAEAVPLLEGAVASFPGEAELSSLLMAVRRAKTAQEEQEYVRATLAQIAAFEARQDLRAALEQAEHAQRRYPYHADLAAIVRRLRDTLRQQERRQQLTRHVQSIEAALAASDWERAAGAVQVAAREFPGEKVLEEFEERIRQARSQAELESLALQVRSNLQRNDVDAASQRLKETETVFQQTGLWQALRREVQRHRDYGEGLREAAERRRRGELEAAEKLLEELLAARPPDDRAAALLEEVRTDRAAARRRSRMAEHLRVIDQSLAAGDWNAAGAALEAAEREFPGEVALAEARVEVCLARNDLAEAERCLAAAESGLPGGKGWPALRQRLERRRNYERALESAERCCAQGDYAEAEQMLRALLAQEPRDGRAVALLEKVTAGRLGREREEAVRQGVAEAERCLQRGDPTAALAVLDPLYLRFPDEPAISRARQAAEERQWIAQTARDIAELEARGQVREALARAASACERYPQNAELNAILERLRQAAWGEQRERFAKAIERLLKARKPQEAARQLEAARAAFPGEALWKDFETRIEQLRQARLETEFANQVLARAADLQKQQPGAALREVEAALARYPANAELAAAAGRLREAVRQEERRTHLRRIEEAIAAQQWDHAEAALDEARRQFAGEKTFGDLEAAIAAGRRQEQQEREREHRRLEAYEQGLAQAEEQRRHQDLRAAEKILRRLLGDAPPDLRAATLLQAVTAERLEREREQAIGQGLEEAQRLTAAREFGAAIALIDRLRQQFPDEARLGAARQATRRQAYDDFLAEADRRRQQGDYPRAEELLAPLAAQDPDGRATALLGQVRAERRQRERSEAIGQGLAHVEGLLRQDDVSGALAVLNELQGRFPDDAAIAQARKAVEERLSAAQALAEVAGLEARREWRAALAGAKAALARHPQNRELAVVVERLRQSHRREQCERFVQEVQRRLAAGQLDGAAEQLEAAQEAFPDEAATWEALAREVERQRVYAQVLLEAEAHRAAGHYLEAEQALEAAAGANPPDSQAATLLQLVRGERARKERDHAIAEGRQEAERLGQQGDWLAALELLDSLCRRYPDHPGLAALRQAAEARMETDAVNQAMAHASDFQQQDPHAALRELEAGLLRYPQNRQLAAAAERLRQFLQQEERRQGLAAAVAGVEAALAARDWARAERELADARRRFGDERVFPELETALRQGQRRHELDALAARVRELLAGGKIEEASRELAAGKRAYSGEAVWRELQAGLERSRVYEQALNKAETRRSKGDLRGAEEMLRRLVAENPPDTRAAALLHAVIDERMQKDRGETIRRGREEADRPAAQPVPAPPIPAPKPAWRRPALIGLSAVLLAGVAVAVWVSLQPAAVTLTPSTTVVTFAYLTGDRVAAAQAVTWGQVDQPFEVTPSDAWIEVTPRSGARLSRLEVRVNPEGFPEGTRRGSFTVKSGQASSKVVVILDVKPRPPAPLPVPAAPVEAVAEALRVRPRELEFRHTAGRPAPAGQTITILQGRVNSAGASEPWLQWTQRGNLIDVSVRPEGLPAGQYMARLTLGGEAGDRQQVTVRLRLEVPPAAPALPPPPPAAAPKTAPKPTGRYQGKPFGSITWSGELQPGQEVVLEPDRVISGGGQILFGEFPGRDASIQISRQPAGIDARVEDGRMRIRNTGPQRRSGPVMIEWRVLP